MPLLWIAEDAPELIGYLAPQAEQDLMALAGALTAVGWAVVGAVGYWFGSSEPNKPTVDTSWSFEPAESWQCANHPGNGCYGVRWGCADPDPH